MAQLGNEYMKTVEKNVINTLGTRGAEWLRSLPLIIQKLSQHWQLTEITPVSNMSWNYVAYAKRNITNHVVLKISCDDKLILAEYRALIHFDSIGAIKVIDISKEHNALLLEQAIPGDILKINFQKNMPETILIYSQVVRHISSHTLPDSAFTHVREWCASIDKINDPRINSQFVESAKQLKTYLLNSVKQEYLCHGDLHLENIIKHGSQWVAIDPKGIIGEMAFEAAAFDLLCEDEINENSPAKIIYRVSLLSESLDIDYNRLLAWVFLRVIISAQWFVEDKGDPSRMLRIANFIHPLLSV